MLDIMTYVNHKGERIEFGKSGLYLNTSDIRDYKWDYTASGKLVSSFTKNWVEKRLPYVICAAEEQAVMLKNRIIEVSEKDILNKSPGKLYVNDEYLECYIIESKKSNYLTSDSVLIGELTVLAVRNSWMRELTFSFPVGQSATEDGKGYPSTYPYDYGFEGSSKYVLNPHYADCEFIMTIYGEVSNPTILLGGHEYSIDVDILKDEYLRIDSRKKTIIKTRRDGITENVFRYRNKESYIFQPVPSGQVLAEWNGTFGFDITLFAERSEPTWI